jgi:hypothetical protein
MSDTPKEVARLMKRCQIGVGGRNAIDDAHDIMAECYGTLGKLSADLAERTRERDEFQRMAGANGLAGLEMGREIESLRAEVERLRGHITQIWDACQIASHKPASSPYLTRLWMRIGEAHGALTPAEVLGPSKEWCARMAELEGDSEIGAGPMANVMPAEVTK